MNEKLMIALRSNAANDYLKEINYTGYLREQELGKIKLPTGKIVANDPLIAEETEPFTICVTPGEYPVMLYVNHSDGDQRVAFAEIRFLEDMPVRFAPALVEGQDLEELEEDEVFCYGVDTGTGCFMDEQTSQKLMRIFESFDENALPESFDEGSIFPELPELGDMLDESYVDTYMTANYVLPGTELNIVAFSSGYGDGAYPSYWGYDASGNICCLITDFYVIDLES